MEEYCENKRKATKIIEMIVESGFEGSLRMKFVKAAPELEHCFECSCKKGICKYSGQYISSPEKSEVLVEVGK
jgi:hypothetical protein